MVLSLDEEKFLKNLWIEKQEESHSFYDRALAESFIQNLFDLLFIHTCKENQSFERLEGQYEGLKEKLRDILYKIEPNDKKVNHHINLFFSKIPSIYSKLVIDAEEILKFDPAAYSKEEIYISYPGFFATAIHRFAHQFYLQKIKILPRVISEYAHSKTGVDINPGAKIGSHFFIDHGTGVVIGETTIIGNHVKIYQGVTLGALNVSKDLATTKRHPTIEDNVILYSNATILGGETVIGRDSLIGGNVWLTDSVLPNSVVFHTPQIRIKDKNTFSKVINFSI